MLKSHDLTNKKKIVEILAVTLVLGFGLLIYDYIDTQKNFDNTLQRNEAGLGINKENLILEYLGNKEEIEVEVSEKLLSEDEVEKAFDKAIAEINATYLGDNLDANNVYSDLNLQQSYAEGLVKASYKIDKPKLVSSDGVINAENVSKKGDIVTIRVSLSYENQSKDYEFSIVVKKPGTDTKTGQMLAIKESLASADESSRDKNEMQLPQKVESMDLTWFKKMNYRGIKILLLGIAAVIALILAQKEETIKAKREREKELIKDYPMIVSELSILMSAGMSFRTAVERICNAYKTRNEVYGGKKAGYEELLILHRQINEGIGELAAIEQLGNRVEQRDYRRLSLMLSQSIKKGSRELLDNLEKEEIKAFEDRKQRALKLGEEASTKLLLPMGGMLLIVMGILIVPALMQMKI